MKRSSKTSLFTCGKNSKITIRNLSWPKGEENIPILKLFETKTDYLISSANIIDDWNLKEYVAAFNSTYFPGSKTAVYYHLDLYYYLVWRFLEKTEPSKLLDTRLMLDSIGLVFPSHHFLYAAFDRKLQQYIEADLIAYNVRKWHENVQQKKFKKFIEPFAVLTFEELEAGFVVCMVPLVLSIFVFVMEWMPLLKDLLCFLIIFKKYFDVKKLEQLVHTKAVKARFAIWQVLIREKDQKRSGTSLALAILVRENDC